MGFQYQSVAALAPLVARDLGASLADIGLLFGLYLAPGIVLAYPGGSVGRRLGDKPVVLAGLALMVAGGAVMAIVPTWTGQIAGRLLAGFGGVLLNVIMSKMVTDWFAGREIATAMAVFVNSWPVGIAAALLVLPSIGETHGVGAAYLFAALLVLFGLMLLAQRYAAPPGPAPAAAAESGSLGRDALKATIAAGVIWGLYNVGFAMMFAFAPSLLVEQGWSVTAAGSVASLVLWLAVVSVPLGGLLADRAKVHTAFAAAGCFASSALMVIASREQAVVPVYALLGLVAGLPAGSIMSLPARVLEPASRATGMGVFFSVFYAAMVAGPALGGWLAAVYGTASVALDFGAVMLFACIPGLWIFNRLSGTRRQAVAA